MNEAARIADQLKRTQEGSAWHGPALGELLGGVDAEQAKRRPLAAAHNVWELVLHITAWQAATLGAVQGKVMPELTESQDWPPAGSSASDWKQALATLQLTSQELVAAVGGFPEHRLGEQVPGRDYSFYFLLHGIAQHNLYHAGQIALLKKLA